MRIYEIIWKAQFIEKLLIKHSVVTDEVEQVLFSQPLVRKANKGKIKGEDVYIAYGQTDAGRYLIVIWIRKNQIAALPISARDMTPKERKHYERHR
ncbi:MAG: BrnT family toxin [Cyanobacteria bacterium P01_A01_bin.114]